MVDSSQTRLASIVETTYGTTPSSPVFLIQRFTSESLKPGIQNVVSNEIRADRNVADLVQVGFDAGGEVNFELSYGSFDVWLESLLFSTWSTNVLKNGTTQKSFTIEKTFEAGATDQYHRFLGAVANTMSLQIQANQIVTGTFGFLAKQATSAQAAIASSSYTAANTNPIINPQANFGSLAITGATSPEITAINLNITNNLRQQSVIGQTASRGIGTGRFEVSGDVTAYFTNAELYELYLAGTAADLSFRLGGASSLKYVFDVGTIKFETAEVLAGGNDQDVLVKMGFRGLYDSSDAATLKITRTP
jgi:hypothetical protein